jgi:hypothetical protein
MTTRLLNTQRIVNLSSDPVSGSAGEVYFNTSDQELKVYNGSIWEPLGGASGNVVFYQEDAPTSPAIGDIWVDSDENLVTVNSNQFILRSGDSFTGSISGITPTEANNLATKEYVDNTIPPPVDTGLNPFFLGGM